MAKKNKAAKAEKTTLTPKEFANTLEPLTQFVASKTTKSGEERLLDPKKISDEECFNWVLSLGKVLPALLATVKAASVQAKQEGDGKLIKGVTAIITAKKKSKAPKINVSKIRKAAIADMKTVRNITTAAAILTPYIKGGKKGESK